MVCLTMATHNVQPFGIFGDGKRLVIAWNGHESFVIERPFLRDCTISCTRPEVGICSESDDFMVFPSPPVLDVSLTLSASEIMTYSAIPKELLTADDLTVRQLFSVIDRKLKKRA